MKISSVNEQEVRNRDHCRCRTKVVEPLVRLSYLKYEYGQGRRETYMRPGRIPNLVPLLDRCWER